MLSPFGAVVLCFLDWWATIKRRTMARFQNIVGQNSPKPAVVLPKLLQIERRTGRTVTIETALTDDNLATCDPQNSSPLYDLPKELRDLIFSFATAPFEELQHPYPSNAFYRREYTE